MSYFFPYPSATSSTIISAKPTAVPIVPILLCSPFCASGISSSTTTYSIAPAANERKYGSIGDIFPAISIVIEQLSGFCYGKDLELPVVHQVALLEKTGDIGGLLFFGQVGAQVNGKAHLIQRKGGVCVGGDDVGQLFGTHLALGGGQHAGLQVVHAALTGAFDSDVLLFAHGGVELLHQLVEAFQLIAVVIGPDRDGGGQLASAAGSAAQRHGGAQQQTDGRTEGFVSLHYLSHSDKNGSRKNGASCRF